MALTVPPLEDSRALRAALGQFATGVAIVTARDGDGRRAGVTANSLRGGPFGALLLDGALAQLVCRVRERRETGDHVLFVSEVVHHRRVAGEPLIFHASEYGTIARRPPTPARREVPCCT